MKGAKNCGEVVSVGQHHSDRTMARVTVAHGTRKPKPKDTKRAPGIYPSGDYDDRSTSEHVIPKEHARKFGIGQKVNVKLEPAEDEGAEDDGPSIADMKKSATSGLHRAMHPKRGLGTVNG